MCRARVAALSAADECGFPHPYAGSESWAKISAMAVLLRLNVTPATQDQFNALDAKVGQSMTHAGGPPAGLMSHAVYPDGDGFVIAEVWRAEPEGQSYIDDVLRPLLDESGLAGQDTWSARSGLSRGREVPAAKSGLPRGSPAVGSARQLKAVSNF